MSETLRDACRASLDAAGKTYHYYSLAALAKTYPALEKLPYSLKVLLENLLRNEDGGSVTKADIEALANWADNGQKGEIAFRPSRILLQDFTGVPAVVDLAAMRDAMQTIGGNPEKINPLSPVDLVIDHCNTMGVQVALSSHWANGGSGATDLAELVADLCDSDERSANALHDSFVYPDSASLWEKIEAIALKIYGASEVTASTKVRTRLKELSEEVNRVRRLPAIALVNRHPNIAFFGGTVVIAIIVLAAFANVANAGGFPTANPSQPK